MSATRIPSNPLSSFMILRVFPLYSYPGIAAGNIFEQTTVEYRFILPNREQHVIWDDLKQVTVLILATLSETESISLLEVRLLFLNRIVR